MVAPPEISEPQQETEQSVSSQPTVAPSEQRELPEKADLRQAEARLQPVKEDAIEKTEERIIHREKWLLSQEVFLLYDPAHGCAQGSAVV